MNANDGVAPAAMRLYEKFGVEWTRQLVAALDRLAYVETGEGFALSAHAPAGGDDVELSAADEWLDPAEYPPDEVEVWSEPTGFELSAPDASRYQQRKLTRGPRKDQTGWYDVQGERWMPASWRPAAERPKKDKPAPKPKAGAAPKAAKPKKWSVDEVHEALKATHGRPATAQDAKALGETLGAMNDDEVMQLRVRMGLSKTGGTVDGRRARKADRVSSLVEKVMRGLPENKQTLVDPREAALNSGSKAPPANKQAGGDDERRGDGPRGGRDGGPPPEAGRPVAGEAGRPGARGADKGGPAGGKPAGDGAARRVPAEVGEVGKRLDRYEKLFRSRGNHQVGDLMAKLRDHLSRAGGEEALRALGEDRGGGDGATVGYTESEFWKESMGDFVEAYLDRHGIVPVANLADPAKALKASPFTTEYEGLKPDFAPKETVYNDKLQESKDLPGLESSEDVGEIMGRPVTHLTPDVIEKLDGRYGKGQWIVKTYSAENAFAGFGVYFPQRAAQVAQDARNTIWAAGGHLSRYGFELKRDGAGKVVGLKHSGGDEYDFGTPEYEKTIGGDARHWAEQARAAADHEGGMMLPNGGKEFMAQPAFPVVGASEADRAAGKTIVPGEGRVHVLTRPDGGVDVIPHSTWLKGESLPVVFEDEDTKAMAEAAREAISKLPEAARKGQLFAPDVVKTKDGYRVVELNASVDGGGSGYLIDNPFIIDAYVSHLTGREPGHVRFVRKLLTRKPAGERPAGPQNKQKPAAAEEHPLAHLKAKGIDLTHLSASQIETLRAALANPPKGAAATRRDDGESN